MNPIKERPPRVEKALMELATSTTYSLSSIYSAYDWVMELINNRRPNLWTDEDIENYSVIIVRASTRASSVGMGQNLVSIAGQLTNMAIATAPRKPTKLPETPVCPSDTLASKALRWLLVICVLSFTILSAYISLKIDPSQETSHAKIITQNPQLP